MKKHSIYFKRIRAYFISVYNFWYEWLRKEVPGRKAANHYYSGINKK